MLFLFYVADFFSRTKSFIDIENYKTTYERSHHVLLPFGVADQVVLHDEGVGEGLLIVDVGVALDNFVLKKSNCYS